MINKYSIVNEITSEQFGQLHALYQEMWWSKDRTKEEISATLKRCLLFAVIDNSTDQLTGFARVLTDEVRYAYIYDVMTLEHLRCKGIGKMIMQAIFTHPLLSRVNCIELTCTPEMVSYYSRFGFSKNYGEVVPLRRNNGAHL